MAVSVSWVLLNFATWSVVSIFMGWEGQNRIDSPKLTLSLCCLQFRELCGPKDPELGRVLRPKSLRAQFGLNKIRNGFHCTDLAGRHWGRANISSVYQKSMAV